MDKIPEKDLAARICQISYFGQHPIKLFHKAHKMKKLAITSIFGRDLLSSGFMRANSMARKETDVVMLLVQGSCSIVSVQKIAKTDSPPMCVFKIRQHVIGKEFTIDF